MKLTIVQAKPNPAGKDKQDGKPLATKLLGEWVDVRNDGTSSITFAGVSLDHTAYDEACRNPNNKPYWAGKAEQTLAVGQTMRLHTGKYQDRALMAPEDGSGVHLHAYAESGSFVLNNKCGDALALWFNNGNWTKLDGAAYDPNPKEGAVLRRVGDKLK